MKLSWSSIDVRFKIIAIVFIIAGVLIGYVVDTRKDSHGNELVASAGTLYYCLHGPYNEEKLLKTLKQYDMGLKDLFPILRKRIPQWVWVRQVSDPVLIYKESSFEYCVNFSTGKNFARI